MAFFKTKFGTGRQDWETPDSLFAPLNSEFNFTLDVCATRENSKCKRFLSVVDNALKIPWRGVCWMNPPFGTQGKWVAKAYSESQHYGVTVVCLLPCRTNTNWWHDYVMKGDVRFIRGRPKFKGAEHGLPQPLAIVIFYGATNRYRIQEFSHSRWHVLAPNQLPVYDESPNGDDKPLVFTNEDTAIALADRLNAEYTP